MRKYTKRERELLELSLNRILDGTDGVYIPKRVELSDKLTLEQLYGLLCMEASTSGVVANGEHIVYILNRLVTEVTHDLERLKKLGFIVPIVKDIGFCRYEVTYWHILNLKDVINVKNQMLKGVQA